MVPHSRPVLVAAIPVAPRGLTSGGIGIAQEAGADQHGGGSKDHPTPPSVPDAWPFEALHDAVASIHAGAGGTESQDWAGAA